MDIETELIKKSFCEKVVNLITEYHFHTEEEVNKTALKMIGEIKGVLSNENLDEYDVVENIVSIFDKYDVDIGSRNDF